MDNLEDPVVNEVEAERRNEEVLRKLKQFCWFFVLRTLEEEERRVRDLLQENPWLSWRAAVDTGTLEGMFDPFGGKPIRLECTISSEKSESGFRS
jgi:hypothetical protein